MARMFWENIGSCDRYNRLCRKGLALMQSFCKRQQRAIKSCSNKCPAQHTARHLDSTCFVSVMNEDRFHSTTQF